MKLKTTYEQLFIFARAAQAWLAKDKANPATKMGYAIHKMITRTEQHQNRYNNAVADLQADNCATDDKGVMLRDARGGLEYTKDGFKKLTKQRQALYETDIEVEVYYATLIPTDLTDVERDEFAGFVLDPTIELVEAEAAEISEAVGH
jgi:hypothetical protein